MIGIRHHSSLEGLSGSLSKTLVVFLGYANSWHKVSSAQGNMATNSSDPNIKLQRLPRVATKDS